MKKSIVCILAAAFLFGTMEVSLKLAGASFDPIQMTFLRFLIGGLCLFPFALYDLKKRQCHLTKSDWLYLFLLGFTCICVSMLLFQIGVLRTNANLAAVVISTSPVFTMIFAQFFANEKFTLVKFFVLLLNVMGLIIVANPIKLMKGHTAVDGILITLIAAASFGLYTAMGKKRIAKIGGLTQSSFSFIMGSLVLLVIQLAKKGPVMKGIQPNTLPLLLYLGVLVTGFGYFCYIRAIEVSGPSTASITFFIKPVFAPIIAFLILKEPITLNIILGVVFVLSGSLLNLFGEKIRASFSSVASSKEEAA
ncbi:MAG TPA: DMT family transporter [Clostridia bacterium]|nr:DMT family transporter [Clostridia bacterium]